jgi:hypothetical protein
VILPVLRRFVALLLALALFAPASAFGRVLYACSMSGKVSAGRCCCHKSDAKPAADQAGPVRPAKVDRPGCCEMQDHRRAALSAATSAVDVQVLAAEPTQLLPAAKPCADAANVLRPHPHAARGPPPGSPVYVVNCSLLI